MALPQKHRIGSSTSIETVFSKGRTLKANYVLFKFFRNELDYSRFAIVVSKKVSKKAVTRNLIKRRILSLLDKKYFLKNNFDVIIMPTIDILEKSPTEIKKDLESIMEKIFV